MTSTFQWSASAETSPRVGEPQCKCDQLARCRDKEDTWECVACGLDYVWSSGVSYPEYRVLVPQEKDPQFSFTMEPRRFGSKKEATDYLVKESVRSPFNMVGSKLVKVVAEVRTEIQWL